MINYQIRYISKENYDDIPVERAIYGYCGYLFCDKELKTNVSKQKYIIRSNVVYDITNRMVNFTLEVLAFFIRFLRLN